MQFKYRITFVFASHPVGGRRVDDLTTDDVSENPYGFVRPVVFFENLFVVQRSTVRHQHDSLVTLGPSRGLIILMSNNNTKTDLIITIQKVESIELIGFRTLAMISKAVEKAKVKLAMSNVSVSIIP